MTNSDTQSRATRLKYGLFALALCGVGSFGLGTQVAAQSTAFRQAVAEKASVNDDVAKFYRENTYAALWTGADEASSLRRAALLRALQEASDHGLPDQSGTAADLVEQMRAARTARDFGQVEAALSAAFVTYAEMLQTGLLRPSTIDDGMVRTKRDSDGTAILNGMRDSQPFAYLRTLVPASPQYRALMREKIRLEQRIRAGGWGPTVPGKKLEPGDQGRSVVALRNRLIAQGYMQRNATARYDSEMERAVERFQSDHGLEVDGVAGAGTLKEINRPVRDRLKSVIIAMERGLADA